MISNYYDFWRSCDTEDRNNEIQQRITGINDILTYIQTEKLCYFVIIFHNITVSLLYFWSNKCIFQKSYQPQILNVMYFKYKTITNVAPNIMQMLYYI